MMQIGFYLDHYFIHHFLEIFVVIIFMEDLAYFIFATLIIVQLLK